MFFRIKALYIAGPVSVAASVLGCGAGGESMDETAGKSEAALVATVIHPYGTDERRYDSGEWSSNNWKGECALNETVSGASRVFNPQPNGGAMHGIRCAHIFNANGTPVTKALNIMDHDDRTYSGEGDWHYGFIKAECGANAVVSGISQSSDYKGVIVNVKCLSFGQTFKTNCRRVDISDGYIPPLIWDTSSYAQNNCRDTEVVRGISKSTNSSGGQIRALLCCTPDPIIN